MYFFSDTELEILKLKLAVRSSSFRLYFRKCF